MNLDRTEALESFLTDDWSRLDNETWRASILQGFIKV